MLLKEQTNLQMALKLKFWQLFHVMLGMGILSVFKQNKKLKSHKNSSKNVIKKHQLLNMICSTNNFSNLCCRIQSMWSLENLLLSSIYIILKLYLSVQSGQNFAEL